MLTEVLLKGAYRRHSLQRHAAARRYVSAKEQNRLKNPTHRLYFTYLLYYIYALRNMPPMGANFFILKLLGNVKVESPVGDGGASRSRP